MIVTAALIILAGLSYLGSSLVMLTSVGGMAVTLWFARRRPVHVQLAAVLLGAIGAALLAEVVHLLYHQTPGDQPDHGGFWLSAVLVGGINGLAMLPIVWFEHARAMYARRATTSETKAP